MSRSSSTIGSGVPVPIEICLKCHLTANFDIRFLSYTSFCEDQCD